MKPKVLLAANTLSLAATLFINYYIGTGAYNGRSIGQVSSQYPTLLTPASYAFSIWGLIYLMLTAFVGYQWYFYFKGRNEESLLKAGIWFSLVNVANALWIFSWVNEATGLSVLIICFLLFSLIMLVIKLGLEVWDAPLRIIAFVWWPICVYTGWIIVATVTNATVFLSTFDWSENILAPEMWAIIIIAVATLIYLFLTYKRNMREAAMVGVWGLSAIAYDRWEGVQSVAIAALLAAGILLIYAAYHGYQHKDTSPYMKLKRNEI